MDTNQSLSIPTTDEIAMIDVTTVPASIVPKGKVQITARTRAVKGTVIPANQRSRSIIIPELMPDVRSKYTTLVTSALYEVARDQLAAAWDADANVRAVSLASYSEDGLLLYAAKQAESKKLSGAAILAWFDQSELKQAILAKQPSKEQLAKLVAELENIAAPVLSRYTEEKALQRIVMLGKFERDAEHEIVISMISRLQRFIDALRTAREELGSVEDIEL